VRSCQTLVSLLIERFSEHVIKLSSVVVAFVVIVLSSEALTQPGPDSVVEAWGMVLGCFLLTWAVLDTLVPHGEKKRIWILLGHFAFVALVVVLGHLFASMAERLMVPGTDSALGLLVINPRTVVYFSVLTIADSIYLGRIVSHSGSALESISEKLERSPSLQSSRQGLALLGRIAESYLMVVFILALWNVSWVAWFEILPAVVSLLVSFPLLCISIRERLLRRVYFGLDLALLSILIGGSLLKFPAAIWQLVQLLSGYLGGLTWSSRFSLIWAMIFNGLAVAVGSELAFRWCEGSVLAKLRKSSLSFTSGYVP